VDAALVGAGEQGVLAVEGDRVDRALDHIGVDLDATFPTMLAEHPRIVEALGRLADAAVREGNRQVAQFAEKLKLRPR
jgi:hypothetical protein